MEYEINQFCVAEAFQRQREGSYFLSRIEEAVGKYGMNVVVLNTNRISCRKILSEERLPDSGGVRCACKADSLSGKNGFSGSGRAENMSESEAENDCDGLPEGGFPG